MRRAHEDLALAEDDVGRSGLVPRGSCVWAHLAAEKAIKALLVARDIDPPKRHDLDELCGFLPAGDVDSFRGLSLVELSRWAIDGRYPDDFDEATAAQALRAIDLARQVIAVVEARLVADEPSS